MSKGGRPSTKRRPQKRRITEDEKDQIAKLIEQGVPRNEIARQTSRSAGSVTKLAKDRGLSFDRSSTKHATEARKADHARILAELQGRFLEETQKALDELHDGATLYHWGDGKFMQAEITAPDFKAKRDIMWRAGSAIRNFLEIDNRGTTGDDADTALEAFMKALEAEAEKRDR